MNYGDHFKNKSKIPTFVIMPFLTMLNLEVNILSLQQLEHETDRIYYPVDYIFLKIGYCGHPTYPFTNIQLKQASHSIPSHFQE